MVTVVLTGFMGTGKTCAGRMLAQRLNRPFVDTDALIERAERRPVAEIFAAEGEAYFRAAEKRAVAEAITIAGAVIATGGGTIADPDNFARLHAAGPIVCLAARPEVILARTQAAGTARPLLAGGHPRQRIEALLAERAAAYARADITVDTSARSIDEVVDAIAAFLRRTRPPACQASA